MTIGRVRTGVDAPVTEREEVLRRLAALAAATTCPLALAQLHGAEVVLVEICREPALLGSTLDALDRAVDCLCQPSAHDT